MGILKPTPQQLEAMVRLRGNPDFTKVMEAVRDYELAMTDWMVSHEAPTVYRDQGAISALRQFRSVVESAPEMLRKLSTK